MIYQIVLSYFAVQQEQEDVREYVNSGGLRRDMIADGRSLEEIRVIEEEFKRV